MLLGVDYGRAKLGLARAEGPLAEIYRVIRVESIKDAVEKVAKVAQVEQAERVIVGVSEGRMAEEQKDFAKRLGDKLDIPVKTWDETLSTLDAQALTISMGIGRKRRREKEDAYAALIMLQSFIDSKRNSNV
ncbi:MAG: Holliday junction resolvase RuvX [Candidatus Blackburnbacteria bacterium]|nr:Holliday junction resolvase RuvX [Candidatus Blackburnbacteria bacterium]